MSNTKRIVVIGGSAAGPKAAARARRLDPEADITILQKDPDLSMASCGYPYYIGGVFSDRKDLLSTPAGVVRNAEFFHNVKGITARTKTEVLSIDRAARTLHCKNLKSGQDETVGYDKLIIATGSVPRIPPVSGHDLSGITPLKSMEDTDYLRKKCDERKVTDAVVIGGGLIGIETAEALQRTGIQVTVVELLPQILMFLDWDLAKTIENHMKSNGVRIITGNGIAAYLGEGESLSGARLQDGTEISCTLAVVATGAAPNVALAREADLAIGETGGLEVNEYLQTSDPDIYAAGDCIETTERITGGRVLAPYGDLANLQGRVAGENAALGNKQVFPGTILSGICKVFDHSAGSTGLSVARAEKAGISTVTVVIAGPDKPHFMEGRPMVTKMVAEAETGRILGMQCVGPGDVSRQVAEAAMAIRGGLTITDLANADLPYAPPFSPAIDNLITAAHVLQNKIHGAMKGISSTEVKERLDAGEDLFMLDVRSPAEYEAMCLGVGETLIPLGALRKRLGELPEDKKKEIICYCKISLRGYEAARIIEGHGWENVKVMEGGLVAWPYELG